MMNKVSHNNSQFGPKTQVEVRNIQSASNQDSDAPSKSTGKRVFTVDQLAKADRTIYDRLKTKLGFDETE